MPLIVNKKNKLLNLSKTKNNSMDKNNRINLVNSYERIDNQISRNNTKKNSYLNISKMQANIRNNYYNILNKIIFRLLNAPEYFYLQTSQNKIRHNYKQDKSRYYTLYRSFFFRILALKH